MSKMKRGKNPSRATVCKLWLMAGGRCQFPGCNHNLMQDTITWQQINVANVAHIVASSPDGPRGSEESYDLSDKLENLMLLCLPHHKVVDEDVTEYTVERLKEIKRLQEQKVQELLEGMNYPESEIVVLESPIKGEINVHVDKMQAVAALRSIHKKPASAYPQIIQIRGCGDYSTEQYWDMAVAQLMSEVRELNNRFRYVPELMLSVFPLAPIPLISKLGELLGDKRGVDIFQKTREPDTWNWISEELTNSFEVSRQVRPESTNKDEIAIILSLTADVAEKRVLDVVDAAVIYQIRAERIGVDCISSTEDLKEFWQQYQTVCDCIKNKDHCNKASVFPAIPVSAAFEIGRRHMPGAHPELDIYEECHGFFKAVTIGG